MAHHSPLLLMLWQVLKDIFVAGHVSHYCTSSPTVANCNDSVQYTYCRIIYGNPTRSKTKTGLNVKILGGSNTVNAGGHGMITSKARSEGFSRVVLTKFGNDRYARIARITLSGWLAREDRLSLLEQVQEVTQEKATSSTFNNLIGELVEVATMAMDEGYVPSNTIRNTGRFENDVCTCGTNLAPQPCQSWSCISKQYTPPTVHSDDIAALIEVIDKVGVNQGWSENNARNLGDHSVYQLVVEILGRSNRNCILEN